MFSFSASMHRFADAVCTASALTYVDWTTPRSLTGMLVTPLNWFASELM